MSFKQIFKKAKADDQNAIEELLLMYQPLLLKESILDNVLDEDLYQELCIVFLRCIRLFEP